VLSGWPLRQRGRSAQALPVVGALGGPAVNNAFMEHFQDVALGRFTVRRLERTYGKERIRTAYDLIAAKVGHASFIRWNAGRAS
jgi:hypothetical protein